MCVCVCIYIYTATCKNIRAFLFCEDKLIGFIMLQTRVKYYY